MIVFTIQPKQVVGTGKLGTQDSFFVLSQENTVVALLMDTLISRTLYLQPPSQNTVFLNSPTKSLLIFYIIVSGQPQLKTPFSLLEGVSLPELPLYNTILENTIK